MAPGSPSSPHTSRHSKDSHAAPSPPGFAENSAPTTACKTCSPLPAESCCIPKDETVRYSRASNSDRVAPCESQKNHSQNDREKEPVDSALPCAHQIPPAQESAPQCTWACPRTSSAVRSGCAHAAHTWYPPPAQSEESPDPSP